MPELLLFAALLFVSAQWDLRWSAEFWIKSREITSAIDAAVIQNLIWLVPASLFLCCRNSALYWSPLELISSGFPWRDGVILTCLSLCAQHTIRSLVYGGIGVRFGFRPIFLLLALCVGIQEELFFRGFLLNRMMKAWNTAAAVLISGLCFVVYHYPQLFFGASPIELFSLRSVQIFVMSAVFSAAVIKSRNIVVAIWLHTFWNLLSYLFGLY